MSPHSPAAFLRISLTRPCQPGPVDLNFSTTSGSKRRDTRFCRASCSRSARLRADQGVEQLARQHFLCRSGESEIFLGPFGIVGILSNTGLDGGFLGIGNGSAPFSSWP